MKALNVVPYKLPSAPSNRFDIGVPSKMSREEALERVQGRACARGIHREHRPCRHRAGDAPPLCCPIELAVACLDHAIRCCQRSLRV